MILNHSRLLVLGSIVLCPTASLSQGNGAWVCAPALGVSPGSKPRGWDAAPPAAPAPGWALPAALRFSICPLAAKDTHICIKLLGSWSNSGTSDSNYRCITGTDKSAARQHGTHQC